MYIITKRTRVIMMTNEEAESFLQCVQEAQEGQTVHASERKLKDGSYLGVCVLTAEQAEQASKEKLEQRANKALLKANR